ncbi:MAG: peptidylprolyl isomerase, partial [Candidatus Woesearchaeota archaeon]
FIFVFLFLVTISLIFLNTREMQTNDPNFLKQAYSLNEKIFKIEKKPIAIVNGEKIDYIEIEKRYNSLPDYYKNLISFEDVLNQYIDEKLLTQEIKNKKIDVSQDELNQEIQTFLDYNQLTKEEFEKSLKERNLTIEDVNNFYSFQIGLSKLLNETIIPKINITEKDINKYYLENSDKFIIPESRNVSHLIICHNESISCQSNKTKKEALELIQNIRKELIEENQKDNKNNNKENISFELFSKYVKKYSEEPNANLTNGNLGFLTKQDPIDDNFLNASFSLNLNNLSEVIETQFGYHLILVSEIKPEDTIKYETAKDQINQTLREQKAEDLYFEYLSELRNKSTINIFYTNP